MKYSTTKDTSSKRYTPSDAEQNRARSEPIPEELAGYGTRKRGRRFEPPRGKARGRFTGKLYPNGEFTLGFVAVEKKRVDDSRYERGQVDGVFATSPEPDEVDTTLGSIAVPQEERVFSPLNLAVVQNHHTTFKKYGLSGITTYGKRMVKNAAFILERKYGRSALSMGTLTIPQFSERIMESICSNWGYIVRAFFQEIKRIYEREGLTFQYCSVTEIQPQRWKNHKQVGLHIHFLWIPVWVHWANCWLVGYNEIRSIWRRILQNVVNAAFTGGSSVPPVPSPNFRDERVKKNAGAYMAKYMSKGSDVTLEVVDEKGENWIPSQWWSADTQTKDEINAEMVYPQGEALETLVDICEGNHEPLVVYRCEITMKRAERPPLTVGYAGRLTPLGDAYIRELSRI